MSIGQAVSNNIDTIQSNCNDLPDQKLNDKYIKKVERRTKNVHKYSGKIRERNVCPNCNSMNISKRTTTNDYKCYQCKWSGKKVNKIMA